MPLRITFTKVAAVCLIAMTAGSLASPRNLETDLNALHPRCTPCTSPSHIELSQSSALNTCTWKEWNVCLIVANGPCFHSCHGQLSVFSSVLIIAPHHPSKPVNNVILQERPKMPPMPHRSRPLLLSLMLPRLTRSDRAGASCDSTARGHVLQHHEENTGGILPVRASNVGRGKRRCEIGREWAAAVCNGIGSHVHTRDDMSLLHRIDSHVHTNEI